MNAVTLIDYGIGNLLSVERAVSHLGADLKFARTEEEIDAADKIILPGVGAFSSCVDELKNRGLHEAVRRAVEKQKPVFGICVGMQMLFEGSEEFRGGDGFCFFKGRVKAIPAVNDNGRPHKIPHISWTSLDLPENRGSWSGTMLEGIAPGTEVYFVHSFTAHPLDQGDRLADARYGGQLLSAMVRKGNLFGTQFHPEKSGPAGLKILDNFIKF